jgi:hypothetical protein
VDGIRDISRVQGISPDAPATAPLSLDFASNLKLAPGEDYALGYEFTLLRK